MNKERANMLPKAGARRSFLTVLAEFVPKSVRAKINTHGTIPSFRISEDYTNERLMELHRQDLKLQEKNREVQLKIETLLQKWQEKLPEVQIVLEGSLVAGLHLFDEGTKLIDADVRIVSKGPITYKLQEKITSITGLRYRRTYKMDDWPDGERVSTGRMLAGVVHISGVSLPVEVCALLRNSRQYVGWGQYYRQVLTKEEIFYFTELKRLLLARADKKAYKRLKKYYLDVVRKRCVERGLVEPPNYVLPNT